MNIEELLNDIEGNRLFMILMFLLMSMYMMIPAMQNFSSIFTTVTQPLICNNLFPLNSINPAGNISTITFNDCTAWYQQNQTNSCSNLTFNKEIYHETVQSYYNIDCSHQFVTATSVSIYMFGFLLGGFIYGLLSDRYGRRLALLLSCLQSATFGIIAPFLPSIWFYSIARFLVGFGASGTLSVCFTYLIENTPPKRRSILAGLVNIGWTMGQLILCLLAWILPHFQYLELLVAAFSFSGLLLFCFPPESIRWLKLKQRKECLKTSIQQMARISGIGGEKMQYLIQQIDEINETTTTTTTTNNDFDHNKLLLENEKNKIENSPQQNGLFAFKKLFTFPNLRRHAIVVFINFFIISMAYYGLGLGVGNLDGNLYINAILGTLTEIPSNIFSATATAYFGRITLITIGFFVSGSALLLSATLSYFLLPSASLSLIVVCLCLIGRLFVNMTFVLCFLYVSEIFPTSVRNIGLGSVSLCARIGSLLVPQINLLRVYGATLPMFIYSIGPLLAGGITWMFLIETRGLKIADSLEEGENILRNKNISSTEVI